MTPDMVYFDRAELVTWGVEAGDIIRRHVSTDEAQIMAENAAIRSCGLARDLSFARPLLRMSYAQFDALQRMFPVLRHGSALERTKMWHRIARSGAFRKLQVKAD